MDEDTQADTAQCTVTAVPEGGEPGHVSISNGAHNDLVKLGMSAFGLTKTACFKEPALPKAPQGGAPDETLEGAIERYRSDIKNLVTGNIALINAKSREEYAKLIKSNMAQVGPDGSGAPAISSDAPAFVYVGIGGGNKAKVIFEPKIDLRAGELRGGKVGYEGQTETRERVFMYGVTVEKNGQGTQVNLKLGITFP